ncbi:MAG: N-acetylmuramic acid 6-phosphate etherase [Clostridia bacterium]|nr:N-acetylmuramic acid 6-phosphate etherase [Clostridia bacterium]
MCVLPRGLIVSSQALDGNPLKKPEYLAVMAECAEKGGAVAIRANGYDNILEMKKRLHIPVIGLNKIVDKNGVTIITPNFEKAKEIAAAGADVIALDATFRNSEIKEAAGALIARIHNELHLPVLADISNLEEAIKAEKLGADYISTTLAGYTADKPYKPQDKYFPDFKLVVDILQSGIKIPVFAEGRFWQAEHVERAFRLGCYGVIIGKAITNPMAITQYYNGFVQAGLANDWIPTETQNPYTKDIDKVSTYEMLQMINREDATVAEKVGRKLGDIGAFIDEIFPDFSDGGRILYCGAGTSGRLSVVDAAECPPTYGVAQGKIVASVAGGKDAVFNASENKEDSFADGYEAARSLSVTKKDTLVAVSANGNAQYCLGFLSYGKEVGAHTAAIVNNENTKLSALADHTVAALTGAEVVKGSTRMKAGTAQKMILNMFSTALFVKSGCVMGNLMVNMRPNNVKLQNRAVEMIMLLTEASYEESKANLEACDWSIVDTVKEMRRKKQ